MNEDVCVACQDALDALEQYVLAVSVFLWFDRGRNRDSEDIPLVNTLDEAATKTLSGEEVEQVCYPNMLRCPTYCFDYAADGPQAFQLRSTGQGSIGP
jgi:hypothetical protein